MRKIGTEKANSIKIAPLVDNLDPINRPMIDARPFFALEEFAPPPCRANFSQQFQHITLHFHPNNIFQTGRNPTTKPRWTVLSLIIYTISAVYIYNKLTLQ